MRVYIVTLVDYEEYVIIGVYTSEVAALRLAADLRRCIDDEGGRARINVDSTEMYYNSVEVHSFILDISKTWSKVNEGRTP